MSNLHFPEGSTSFAMSLTKSRKEVSDCGGCIETPAPAKITKLPSRSASVSLSGTSTPDIFKAATFHHRSKCTRRNANRAESPCSTRLRLYSRSSAQHIPRSIAYHLMSFRQKESMLDSINQEPYNIYGKPRLENKSIFNSDSNLSHTAPRLHESARRVHGPWHQYQINTRI